VAGLNAPEFERRAADLTWILCDCDGVLTDNGLYYDRRGHAMLRFNARDGQGLKLAQRAGLKVGILSGRSAAALDHRAHELGLDVVMSGVADKAAALQEFLDGHGVTARQVAYVGDDLPDLVALARCGLGFAPSDAVPEVLTVVDHVLASPGGGGAVREMIEAILKARGDWDTVFRPFTFDR
jgi:3-deoxy-D-manno-octulosonate 8-phosphate phosphatase (KDO 8-P phosphatase)